MRVFLAPSIIVCSLMVTTVFRDFLVRPGITYFELVKLLFHSPSPSHVKTVFNNIFDDSVYIRAEKRMHRQYDYCVDHSLRNNRLWRLSSFDYPFKHLPHRLRQL